MADQVRALNFGLALINLVGVNVLRRAVVDLKPLITADPPIEERAVAKTAELMANIDFDKARVVLPIYCFSIAGSVPSETQKALAAEIETVAASGLPPRVRALTLGLSLTQLVGFEVLKFCVANLGEDIRVPAPPPPPPPPP